MEVGGRQERHLLSGKKMDVEFPFLKSKGDRRTNGGEEEIEKWY